MAIHSPPSKDTRNYSPHASPLALSLQVETEEKCFIQSPVAKSISNDFAHQEWSHGLMVHSFCRSKTSVSSVEATCPLRRQFLSIHHDQTVYYYYYFFRRGKVDSTICLVHRRCTPEANNNSQVHVQHAIFFTVTNEITKLTWIHVIVKRDEELLVKTNKLGWCCWIW